MSRPRYEPTQKDREKVTSLAAVGIPQVDIATVLGIDTKTLRKHYRQELDESATKANGAVAGKLYSSAMSGNVSAQIFWCKTRMGWRETNKVELTGAEGGPVQTDGKVRITFVGMDDDA